MCVRVVGNYTSPSAVSLPEMLCIFYMTRAPPTDHWEGAFPTKKQVGVSDLGWCQRYRSTTRRTCQNDVSAIGQPHGEHAKMMSAL